MPMPANSKNTVLGPKIPKIPKIPMRPFRAKLPCIASHCSAKPLQSAYLASYHCVFRVMFDLRAKKNQL